MDYYYKQTLGEIGERETEQIIRSLGQDMYIVRNLHLPNGDKIAEIDILLIHPSGIYVFECKNFNGWIFGNETNQNWIQSLKGGHKYKFYNPILQNREHVNAIRKHLNSPNIQEIKSFIVFSDRSELMSVPKSNDEIVICQQINLDEYLTPYINKAQKIISTDECEELYHYFMKYAYETLKKAADEHFKQEKEKRRKEQQPAKKKRALKIIALTLTILLIIMAIIFAYLSI